MTFSFPGFPKDRPAAWAGGVWAAVLVAVAVADPVSAATDPAADVAFFETRIRPVLAERCYECHSAESEKLKAGLQVDHLDHLLSGGDTGPSIVPGEPQDSLLMEAIRYGNPDLQMPPKGRLDDAVIADFEKWIAMGAPWPDEPVPARTATGEKVDGSTAVVEPFDLERRRDEHWCWRPIRHPEPPEVSDDGWPRSGIDRFILAGLEAAALKPAGDAAPETWLRRVCFDLVGLPPTPEQVDAFLGEKEAHPDSDKAERAVVDALLASPQFGERWARHWMDLARYAETCGHEFDYPIPHAWRYRDYLIDAFNADIPWDRFLVEHLAGDLLEAPRRRPDDGTDASIVATGFWFLHEAVHAPTDIRGDEAGRIDNQIDVFSKSFLGLTVACARCHDHKFDAISTADYYALAGYLQSSRRQEAFLDPHGRIAAAADEARTLHGRGQELLGSAFGDSEGDASDPARTAGRFAASLMAAEAPPGLDPAILARWIEVLAGEAVDQPEHPLHAWKAGAEDPELRAEWIARLEREAQAFAEARAAGRTIATFDHGDSEGWTATGFSFGDARPTERATWSAGSGVALVTPAGVLTTATMARPFHGVLRSPTFELTHDRIHLRMRSEKAVVRLVVDGHYMNHFSQLLQKGTLLKDGATDTKGRFRWVTLRGDLDKYVGHRVWIEISDVGGGFVELDEVVVSDRDLPPEPDAFATALLADVDGGSREALAAAYGRAWARSLEALARGAVGPGEAALLDLAWQSGLWPRSDALQAAGEAIEALAVPAPVRVTALLEGTPEDERVHIRGSHRKLGDTVPRRTLAALGGAPAPADSSGRLELARSLVSEDNPLVRRVAVNRVWHHLFGRGLVPTVDDFGVMGRPPSHPDLLDWLASEFSRTMGWSVKALAREIVLSRTYRMASSAHPDNDPGRLAEVDPENVLLHKAPVRRLQAEAVRDAILAVSGRLDPAVGGPSVPVHLTPFMEGRGRPGSSGPLDGAGRRSLYLEIRRNFLPPFLLTFDMPIPFNAMGRRSVSNVPAQALSLMNDPFVAEQAVRWAERLRSDASLDGEAARVDRAFLAAFGRPPGENERRQVEAFLAAEPDAARAWGDLCHALLNKKEFIYLD